MKLRKRALVPLFVPFLMLILCIIYLVASLLIGWLRPEEEEKVENVQPETAMVVVVDEGEL